MSNFKKIFVKTIRRWAKNADWRIRQAAMLVCKGRQDVPLSIIKKGVHDRNCGVRSVAPEACEGRVDIPVKTIMKWAENKDWHIRRAAMLACKGRQDVPLEVIEQRLYDEVYHVHVVAAEACEGRNDIPVETIWKWALDKGYYAANRQAAMLACKGRQDIPLETINAVAKACERQDDFTSVETIKQWAQHKNWRIRRGAMYACEDRQDVPLEIIKQGLHDDHADVRDAAIEVCEGRVGITVEIIQQWMESTSEYVRQAAMLACKGRQDVPLEIIQQGMCDDRIDVRNAATEAYEGRQDRSLIRTFEPPEFVYKKCLGDVIVVAKIPEDAQVRGYENSKCRASKAIIVDIIGDVDGEKVGISSYDPSVIYAVGDEITVDNFNMSREECASGFHFFCTLEQAQKYRDYYEMGEKCGFLYSLCGNACLQKSSGCSVGNCQARIA